MSASSKPAQSAKDSAAAKRAQAETSALARIETLDEPDRLRALMTNATRMKSDLVYEAAFRRLSDIQSEGEPGTLENDFWQSIHANEEMLKQERGKAVRLTRTRQKAARVGILKTLEVFAEMTSATDGFHGLTTHKLPEYTGEAVVLKHRDAFSDEVVVAAQARLEKAGIDISTLPTA